MTVEEFHKVLARRNRGKAESSEHALQVHCVNAFRMLYPEYARLLMAIPNGGYRTRTTAALMKAEGQQAGVPDLLLAISRRGYHGLWIEMKNGKAGRVSDNQKEMIALLREHGYACAVCRTQEEFLRYVKAYVEEQDI